MVNSSIIFTKIKIIAVLDLRIRIALYILMLFLNIYRLNALIDLIDNNTHKKYLDSKKLINYDKEHTSFTFSDTLTFCLL